MKNLYWLITIVQRSDTAEYEEFYLRHGVDVTYSVLCNGTAHEKTLSILGIEKTEKAMLFAIVTQETLQKLKRRLTVDMKIDLLPLGTGTLPIPELVKNAPESATAIIVELDYCEVEMWEAITQSYKYMTSNGLAQGNK